MKNLIFIVLMFLTLIFLSFSVSNDKKSTPMAKRGFELPNYNAALDLGIGQGGSCSCTGAFTSCSKSCSNGDCTCTCSIASCSCTRCTSEKTGIAKSPVSIDKNQYKNLRELVVVLNKNADDNSEYTFNLLMKMLTNLKNKNYIEYHKSAIEFEDSLLLLNPFQKDKLNKLFKAKGLVYSV